MTTFDTDEVGFLLHEFLRSDELLSRPRYAHLERHEIDSVISTAASIAERYFAPHNRLGDLNEPHVVDGKVVLIPEVAAACRAYIDSGFMRAHHALEDGGMQIPWCAAMGVAAFFQAANISTLAYVTLTSAAANLLHVFASPEQKQRFLGPMLDGRFFGTMALSEPQAGSSLADIRTTATPNEDGSYALTGTKQWISAGEHELSENIVHLVLAKIKGAPAGVRGISLFIVPRYRVNDDGSVGADNDVRLVSLLHKMGYRGITSTILSFGENRNCRGWLIGEANRGLAYMFHMMNEARIGVGLGAAALGYAGFRYSLEYAMTRLQGRQPDIKDATTPMVRIADHADVRHLLLTQKCFAEGGLALTLYCARLCDDQAVAESADARRDTGLLLDLLTPIAKAWPSQFCLEANSLAIQVLGGYGYTRDYPVEQYYRDNRLNPIHEGTNGIQAIDLLGRKVAGEDGRALRLLDARIRATVASAFEWPELVPLAQALERTGERLLTITRTLLDAGRERGARAMLANANAYLVVFGHSVVAWLWLEQALAAARGLAAGAGAREPYYRGKIDACRYFFRWELPRVAMLAETLAKLDTSVLAIDPETLAP